MQTFRDQLSPVVDCLSVLTRSAFATAGPSFLVRRLNENPDNDFYVRLASPRKPFGVAFWTDEQQSDLEALMAQCQIRGALDYLREANNTSTPRTRLAMLVIAAESIAGTEPRVTKCIKCGHSVKSSVTNRAKLEEILGKEDFTSLYTKKGGALRHKLFHGSQVSNKEIGNLPGTVYDSILLHLRLAYDLKTLDEEVVNAPRTFSAGWDAYGVFLRPEDGRARQLREVEAGPLPPEGLPEGLLVQEPPQFY